MMVRWRFIFSLRVSSVVQKTRESRSSRTKRQRAATILLAQRVPSLGPCSISTVPSSLHSPDFFPAVAVNQSLVLASWDSPFLPPPQRKQDCRQDDQNTPQHVDNPVERLRDLGVLLLVQHP